MNENTKLILKTVLITALITVTVAFLGYMAYLSLTDKDYFDPIDVNTPDGDVTLIIKEWRSFRNGGVYVYQQIDGKEVLIARRDYDKSFNNSPFNDGRYDIVEKGDGALVVEYYEKNDDTPKKIYLILRER